MSEKIQLSPLTMREAKQLRKLLDEHMGSNRTLHGIFNELHGKLDRIVNADWYEAERKRDIKHLAMRSD